MTTGSYPFEGDTIFLLFENIARGQFSIPPNVDESLASLLRGMLAIDQQQRLSTTQITKHR
jgi:serine/threonine protein kinase